MCHRSQVGQGGLVLFAKDLDALADIAQIKRVVEAAHHIPSHLRDAKHLGELFCVARDEVEEGQPLEILHACRAQMSGKTHH